LELPAAPMSSARARSFTRTHLSSWGLDSMGEVASLLVSELVSNVVLHAECDCRLVLEYDGRRLRVGVADADPTPPERRYNKSPAARGMGLLLVEALSCEWGWHPEGGGGKVVWFELEGVS
ncbi:MAG: ATP-binding protein, partial [Acidimicrobiales bacterium]